MDHNEREELIAAIKLMDMNKLAELVNAHSEYYLDSQFADIGEALQLRHDQLHGVVH